MRIASPAYNMLPDVAYSTWRAEFARYWRQGEHVALIGPTGSGKTYTSRDVLNIRDYVLVLAVKREDDTLHHFTRGEDAYTRTKKWPLDYNVHKAVIVLQPENLSDFSQAVRVYRVLDDVFKDGGWCVYLDDTGYIASHLKLRRQIAQLLNTGRSSHLSIVTAMTQVSSRDASVPSETLRQVRHILMWRFEDDDSIEYCARVTGINKRAMYAAMAQLQVYPDGSTDFLAYRRGAGMTLVRQERQERF